MRGAIFSGSDRWRPPFLGYGSQDDTCFIDFTATKKGYGQAAEFPGGNSRRVRPSIVLLDRLPVMCMARKRKWLYFGVRDIARPVTQVGQKGYPVGHRAVGEVSAHFAVLARGD